MTIEVKQLADRTEYYKDGVLHREGGPAVDKSWWVNGIWLTGLVGYIIRKILYNQIKDNKAIL